MKKTFLNTLMMTIMEISDSDLEHFSNISLSNALNLRNIRKREIICRTIVIQTMKGTDNDKLNLTLETT